MSLANPNPHDAIHTLVQSTTVELFHSYGVAVAPAQRSNIRPAAGPGDCAGMIGFTAPRFTGSLTLAVPVDVLKQMRDAPNSDSALGDWVRELTNQLLGRIKNRLMRFQIVLQVGVPIAVNRRAFAQETTGTQSVYVFRALRGRFFVALSGHLDPSALQFSGSINVAGEGDLIIF